MRSQRSVAQAGLHMEAGKDEDTTVQRAGGEEATQTGTPHGNVAATIGEQGVTPSLPEEATAQEGPDQVMTDATPEGEARTEAAQAGKKEAPAGETSEQPSGTTEDPMALPVDVTALLNSPGMVETL